MPNKKYLIFDARYVLEPDDALCHSVCETLEEAREEAPDYGGSCVIVEALETFPGSNQYEGEVVWPEAMKDRRPGGKGEA